MKNIINKIKPHCKDSPYLIEILERWNKAQFSSTEIDNIIRDYKILISFAEKEKIFTKRILESELISCFDNNNNIMLKIKEKLNNTEKKLNNLNNIIAKFIHLKLLCDIDEMTETETIFEEKQKIL